MDTNQQYIVPSYSLTTVPTTQLWIGNSTSLTNAVYTFLKKLFCSHNGCNTCAVCVQIDKKQHHAVTWFAPEKTYTIDDLHNLFTIITFALAPTEHYFFIIEKADYLTNTCANKLLKPIEEPPAGYHFILLAQQSNHILPTIKSRCIIHNFTTIHNDLMFKDIYDAFTSSPTPINLFLNLLSTTILNEITSHTLLDSIVCFWMQEYKLIYMLAQNEQRMIILNSLLTIFKQAQLHLPMPGSTHFFWRDMYLQTHNHLFSYKSL